MPARNCVARLRGDAQTRAWHRAALPGARPEGYTRSAAEGDDLRILPRNCAERLRGDAGGYGGCRPALPEGAAYFPADSPGPRQMPARAHDLPARWTRGLLSCGLAAGPVFVTAFLVEGAIRDGYRPSRHPVSSLALGPRGWIQIANFAVTGTLVLAGAVGLGRAGDPALSTRVGRALTGAAGAGLIGSAVFRVHLQPRRRL